jgi:hypothetical protein
MGYEIEDVARFIFGVIAGVVYGRDGEPRVRVRLFCLIIKPLLFYKQSKDLPMMDLSRISF